MTTATVDRTFSFPGPWLGGVSLIAGPVLLLAGTLLKLGVPFFYPDQLDAYQREPFLFGTAYALFLTGVIVLWPGVVTVASRVGVSRPGWAMWGGGLVLSGLFARTFHHGAGTFAFSLADSAGVSAAGQAVGSYYRYPEWVVSSLSLPVMAGWIVLAAGCYLSGTLRLPYAIALALMSGLMIGVLKGSTWASVVQVTGLAVAFVPLGVTVLRGPARPRWRTVVLAVVVSVVLGRLG
jgi:hypothetical protein